MSTVISTSQRGVCSMAIISLKKIAPKNEQFLYYDFIIIFYSYSLRMHTYFDVCIQQYRERKINIGTMGKEAKNTYTDSRVKQQWILDAYIYVYVYI